MSAQYETQSNVVPSKYLQMKQLTEYTCGTNCLCRDSCQRTAWDKAQYNYYVLGQPLQLAPPSSISEWAQRVPGSVVNV
jgi:hypothetical protein